ncbi:MAG: hypothetical protein GY719_27055 [bacterium]|nr:hypothetical protein [bacterium]
MVIAFVTVFLGLMAGPRTVEVAVGEQVAAVEILLDDVSVGVIEEAPWSLDVDFGERLEPHLLTAVARDGSGGELARVEQWINLPRPAAEAQILLDDEGGGRPRAARLMWSTATGAAPEHVAITLDGEPIEVTNPGRVDLPDHDPEGIHFLRAELRFAPGVEAVAEAAFGGIFGTEVATEMQAVTIAAERPARLPAADKLTGWLVKDGQPLTVRAVDAGAVDVVVVMDLAAQALLEELRQSNVVVRSTGGRRRERADPNNPGYTPGTTSAPVRTRTTRRLAIPVGLRQHDRLRLVAPVPMIDTENPYLVFPVSTPYSFRDGGVFDILAQAVLPVDRVESQQLADSVAVAGIQALSGHHPRVVVLVVGSLPIDRGRWRLPAVRHYLSRLRVPLVVWRVQDPVYRPKPDLPMIEAEDLGPVTEISSLGDVKAAIRALRREVESQRVLWVDGRHLPHEVQLGPAARGVRWPGR